MPVKRILIAFPPSSAAALRQTAREMGVSMTRIVIEAVERYTRNPDAGITRRPKHTAKGERP